VTDASSLASPHVIQESTAASADEHNPSLLVDPSAGVPPTPPSSISWQPTVVQTTAAAKRCALVCIARRPLLECRL
jgi:hypothetical protein